MQYWTYIYLVPVFLRHLCPSRCCWSATLNIHPILGITLHLVFRSAVKCITKVLKFHLSSSLNSISRMQNASVIVVSQYLNADVFILLLEDPKHNTLQKRTLVEATLPTFFCPRLSLRAEEHSQNWTNTVLSSLHRWHQSEKVLEAHKARAHMTREALGIRRRKSSKLQSCVDWNRKRTLFHSFIAKGLSWAAVDWFMSYCVFAVFYTYFQKCINLVKLLSD